jgi:hypothetical protein
MPLSFRPAYSIPDSHYPSRFLSTATLTNIDIYLSSGVALNRIIYVHEVGTYVVSPNNTILFPTHRGGCKAPAAGGCKTLRDAMLEILQSEIKRAGSSICYPLDDETSAPARPRRPIPVPPARCLVRDREPGTEAPGNIA